MEDDCENKVSVDEQKCNEEDEDVDEARIRLKKILFKEMKNKIDDKPKNLWEMENQQLNIVSKFMIKREENDDQVDAIEIKHPYCQEIMEKFEVKQENLESPQEILPQTETDINLPQRQIRSVVQQHKTYPPAFLNKNAKVHILTALIQLSTQGSSSGGKTPESTSGKKIQGSASEPQIRGSALEQQIQDSASGRTTHRGESPVFLTHKNSSGITMYRCEHCSYQTKLKWSLKKHLITHKNPSEIPMYNCNLCSFQTKHEVSVKRHLLIHDETLKATVYHCEHCSFRTRYKCSLKTHLLIHCNPSEITVYRCEYCSFKTKYKPYLKRHWLTHKNPSKTAMIQCKFCSYQSKFKQKLDRHLLTHKKKLQ